MDQNNVLHMTIWNTFKAACTVIKTACSQERGRENSFSDLNA